MRLIPTTSTRGAEMLRASSCDTSTRPTRAEAITLGVRAPNDSQPKGAFRATAVLLCTTLLAACGTDAPPPVTAMPTTAGACEAMRPAMPITYHGQKDQPDTVAKIKAANARFSAACP